jgi:hypothetical protein
MSRGPGWRCARARDAGETGFLPRTSSTTRENASIALRPRTRCEIASLDSPPAHANDAFSGHGVRRVARDGSLQEARLTGQTIPTLASSAHASHAFQCVSGCAVIPHRSRWFASAGVSRRRAVSRRVYQRPLSAHDSDGALEATCFATPSAGVPNAAPALGWPILVCGSGAPGRCRRSVLAKSDETA